VALNAGNDGALLDSRGLLETVGVDTAEEVLAQLHVVKAVDNLAMRKRAISGKQRVQVSISQEKSKRISRVPAKNHSSVQEADKKRRKQLEADCSRDCSK
jgi:hypothetical protein